jgi:predicted dehydrogenase
MNILIKVLLVIALTITIQDAYAKPKMLLVGAGGKQAQMYFKLLQDHVEFVGFVVREINDSISKVATKNNIKIFNKIDIALEELDFDVALVSLPHHLHNEVTTKLLARNKSIIKEKPLAFDSNDLSVYKKNNRMPAVFTIVQRNFQEPFFKAKQDLHLIGTPYNFRYNYHMNLKDMTAGWRSRHEFAQGGVLLDMGYHVIDIINDFFGVPTKIQTQFSYCYQEMRKEKLEDQAQILFNYGSKNLCGTIDISRHYHTREEEFVIEGTNGVLVITPQGYKIFNRDGSVKKEYITTLSREDERLNMFTCYLENLNNQDFINKHFQHHESNVALIERVYQSDI